MPVTPTVASNGMTVPLPSALRPGETLQCDNLDDLVFNTESGEASNVPPSPKFPNQSIQLVLPTSFQNSPQTHANVDQQSTWKHLQKKSDTRWAWEKSIHGRSLQHRYARIKWGNKGKEEILTSTCTIDAMSRAQSTNLLFPLASWCEAPKIEAPDTGGGGSDTDADETHTRTY